MVFVLGMWEGILALAGLVGGLLTMNRFIGIYNTGRQAQAKPFNDARTAMEHQLENAKRANASLKTQLYNAKWGPVEEFADLELNGEDAEADSDMEMIRPLYEEFAPQWMQKIVDFETAKEIVVKKPELIRSMVGWAKNKYASNKPTKTNDGSNKKTELVEAV